MEIGFILKIAGIGIIVAVLNQVLVKRDVMTTQCSRLSQG